VIIRLSGAWSLSSSGARIVIINEPMEVEMKGFVAAIRSAFRAMRRAMARFTEKWVEIGGQLVRMLVPNPAPVFEPDEPQMTEQQPSDDFGHRVRTTASQMIDEGVPSPELLASLPVDTRRWLSMCDDEMLRSITRSSDDQIRDHVKGRKSIRGVLCADPQSVYEYAKALAQSAYMPEESLENGMAMVPA
jgi:hypothetical protein